MDNNVIHEEIEVDVPHQLHFVHFQLPFALIFLYSFFFSLISLAKWNKNYYTTLHCILGYFNSILVLLSNWLLHFRCITFWFYGSYFLSHALLLVPVYTHTHICLPGVVILRGIMVECRLSISQQSCQCWNQFKVADLCSCY